MPGVPRSFDVDRTIPIEAASERLATWVMEGLVAPLDRVASLADFESTGWKDTMPVSYTHLDVYKRQEKKLSCWILI